MSSYQPIDCGDYDFLEIACMDRLEIELTIDSGTTRGIAEGLESSLGEEFLLIRTPDEQVEKIRIDRISEIHVISKVARFRCHRFDRDKKNRAPKM